MDPVLGRKVLDHVTAHREQFDMKDWGRITPTCGTSACLAGWTLLLHGHTVDEAGVFRDSAGCRVGVPTTAAELLKLTDEERWGADPANPGLFSEFDDDVAIARFRALVEAAERQSSTA